MTRAELDYLTAMHDSLFGAFSGPTTQGRTTDEERSHLPTAFLFKQGAVGASAAPKLTVIK